ncbi:MAG: exodeoxyribonuclease VII large subunit [bacterium]|nr:exodeoxyribonuclease VII large subunit [bacterium]MDE0216086.1 exodeoxyribonuclease VII large subunit [bacterium]
MSLFGSAEREAFTEPMTCTVAELADRLKQVLSDAFGDELWVEGEIRNLGRARSGHVYFDLVEPGPDSGAGKQPEASVSVALFRFNRERVEDTLRRHGGMAMEDGMKVRIQGKLDFWPPGGRLQIYMSGIDPNFTLGELEAERQRLLKKLRDEGLLTKNQAVPFPVTPLRIGLVTSKGSAAHHDFCDELAASSLAWEVVLADTPVQGADAPPCIAAAIAAVGRVGVDVIAVVRGGGSRTDLVAFDNEAVARAVADAPVPVVTGVGHEIDRTIVDEVAHEAQKTPTAAAVFIVGAARTHLETAEQAWEAIAGWARRLAADADRRLLAVSQTTARIAEGHLHRAGSRLEGRAGRVRDLAKTRTRGETRKVDDCAGTMRHRAAAAIAGGRHTLERKKSGLAVQALRIPRTAAKELANLEDRARLLDPRAILARGWSITRHDGKVVRNPASVTTGDELVTTLAEGNLHSTVSEGK